MTDFRNLSDLLYTPTLEIPLFSDENVPTEVQGFHILRFYFSLFHFCFNFFIFTSPFVEVSILIVRRSLPVLDIIESKHACFEDLLSPESRAQCHGMRLG